MDEDEYLDIVWGPDIDSPDVPDVPYVPFPIVDLLDCWDKMSSELKIHIMNEDVDFFNCMEELYYSVNL